MIEQNKLELIDFSQSLNSAPFNFNFNLIKAWIERERLRLGGYGIVEGFDLTYDNHFNIQISKGILINRQGDEVNIAPYIIHCDPPQYYKLTETVTIDKNGTFKLKYAPYSPKKFGLIFYNPPLADTSPDKKELYMKDIESGFDVQPMSVIDNMVTVSAYVWANHTIQVEYYYCTDRIDAILVDEQGNYKHLIGLMSDSPSANNFDMNIYYLIGFAKWHIGRVITVSFITTDRTYRKVFVNGDNILYLNGKPYKEAKWIYFEKPENPQLHDVWYSVKDNILYFYEYEGDKLVWKAANDFTCTPIWNNKLYTIDMCPPDKQTFLFADAETDLHFIPNTNALTIIIDQQILMCDQYTEIVKNTSDGKMSKGVGFRLNEPLDREAVVQVLVHHSVKHGDEQDVFQKAAVFVDEGHYAQAAANKAQVFKTELPYILFENQLEVFVNGSKLIEYEEFQELKQQDAEANIKTDQGIATNWFKITKPLKENDIIGYRISRWVWSYDQLSVFVNKIEDKADLALQRLDAVDKRIDNLEYNMDEAIKNLQNQINAINDILKTLKLYRKISVPIAIKDVDNTIRTGLFDSYSTTLLPASPSNDIKANITDGIFLAYINVDGVKPLIINKEYKITPSKVASDMVHIELLSDLVSPDAQLLCRLSHYKSALPSASVTPAASPTSKATEAASEKGLNDSNV